MPTLIDLRRRIRSVQNSQKITQAMKTVSTAKFRKAQRTLFASRPFWHLFPGLMNRLAYWACRAGHPLLDRRDEKKIEVLVLTSDKGLAGAFNSNLLAGAHSFIEEKQKSADVRLVLLGRKAVAFFKKGRWPVDRSVGDHTDKLTRDEVRDLAEFLMRQYAFQKTDAVYLIYSEFKSIMAPRIVTEKLLPFAPDPGPEASAGWTPDWEPDETGLVRFILPLYVEGQIHHALHESQAAEQAARMMAMDNATKNAGDLVEDLVLVLNKIRQAGITKELLEIMTAVEALRENA
ncbi:MAG: ATP synthase F1 subunit gamma [Candidatus Aminicenantales bacterium]